MIAIHILNNLNHDSTVWVWNQFNVMNKVREDILSYHLSKKKINHAIERKQTSTMLFSYILADLH